MANAFGKFKTTLCDDLSKSACRKLCTYFGISAAQTESILENKPVGLALLAQLESEAKIGPRNVHELCDAFKELRMTNAAKKVEEYETSIESFLPESLDSDEDEVTEHQSGNITFEELKRKYGIVKKLTLKDMLEVKDPQAHASYAQIFWTKITSLDHRITSSDLTNENTFSVRDLIFAILHSSDNLLRHDIVRKMSDCQLAVPLVLHSPEDQKPLFLYWAFRTVRKKFKMSSDSDPIERPIFKQALFTVCFLRLGDVRVSKSSLLNLLLSESAGTQKHSFFTGRFNDLAQPIFYDGSIDVVWYTPHERDKGLLKEATALLHLRGDSQEYPYQTEFVCNVSDIVVALIGKQNWQTYNQTVKNIKTKAKKLLFVAIKETDEKKKTAPFDLKHEDIIVVQKLQMKSLIEIICKKIEESRGSPPADSLLTLEDYKERAKDILQLDVSVEYWDKMKTRVHNILCGKGDLKLFKEKLLSLFPRWLKWAELDNTTIIEDAGKTHCSREQQRATIVEAQLKERKKQLNTGLSEEVKHFWELLKLADSHTDLFDNYLIYLRAELLALTYEQQGSIQSSMKFIRDRLTHKNEGTEVNLMKQPDLLKTYLNKAQDEWQMRIGIEDFMRELGQLYEAHVQCSDKHELPVDIVRIPYLAAHFLLRGNSLEILDDKSYCIPRIWISRVFKELSMLLGQTAKVMVLSVIGVQGSGKSTLLNTMFGTKFPVSAGRCTRGLFLRLLKVKESFAMELGCNYIIVLDTEGLKADHGAWVIDKAINRRLDNTMATLAMCLADLIIVNIQGELISSDMTNFLEIAAYAIIRMKEVHLKSQCRIIRQRVSDITAPGKNRNNLLKIIYDLNEAVQNVAKAEGFVDRYENFSEILGLNIEDHTQYVPTLWSGNMNPPNPLYGEVVNKFKSHILDSIQKKDLPVRFTFETFRCKLLAVDKALKEENFALNFEDVSKAIACNEFSLQCNMWLVSVQEKVTDKWTKWQRTLKASPICEREPLSQNFKDEIAKEIDIESQIVRGEFELYLQKNHEEKYIFKEYFANLIEARLSTIKQDIQNKIIREVEALSWASKDVYWFVAQMKKEVRLNSAEKAKTLREKESEKCNTRHLHEHFEKFWDNSRIDILKKYKLIKANDEDIKRKCSTLLQKLCTGNAILKEILRLLDSEGHISIHGNDFACKMYLPTKDDKNVNESPYNTVQPLEERAEKLKVIVEGVKQSILGKFDSDCNDKSFDPHLVRTALQRALADLTMTENAYSIKLPNSLIAKVLLHLCGKISEITIKHNNKTQTECTCQNLFDKQKSSIEIEFKSFYCNKYQNDRACQYVCELISEQLRLYMLDNLRARIIRYVVKDFIQTKRNLYILVLRHLFDEDKPELYIAYINKHAEFLIDWMREKMILIISEKKRNISWLQSQYEDILSNIPPLPCFLVQELSTAISMKDWCEKFTESIFKHQNIRFDLQEASIYQVSNFGEMSKNVTVFYQNLLNRRTMTEAPLPEPGNFEQCESFLNLSLARPYEAVIRSFLGCQEKCPFCKAPCSEENVTHHKKHTAFCHYPRGLTGERGETDELVKEFCTESVSAIKTQHKLKGEYEKHYSSWEIPVNDDVVLQCYWKWVFSCMNNYCANYFHCSPAQLPELWASEYMRLSAKEAVSGASFSDRLQLLWHKGGKYVPATMSLGGLIGTGFIVMKYWK